MNREGAKVHEQYGLYGELFNPSCLFTLFAGVCQENICLITLLVCTCQMLTGKKCGR
jgi:hypothetical protein